MQFKRMIEAAGIDSNNYPIMADAVVNVTDSEDRKLESVERENPIFGQNADSKEEFEEFLKKWENVGSSPINMRVKLTKRYVIIFLYPKPSPELSLPRN